jgi:predicted nucleic acid-binding protein
MAIYLLDTSVVIDAINGKRGRWQLLASLVEGGEELACSAITLLEVYAGMRPRESAATQLFLDALEQYGVDSELARYAGLLKNEWSKRGRTLSIADVLIGATALAHKLVLMTDNRKDFPMPGLALYPLP